MLNLIDKISNEDKLIFETYMKHYSQAGKNYIGNDAFLADWAKNKKKLYKMLGGNLKVSFPFSYAKPKKALREELTQIHRTYSFFSNFFNFIYDLCEKQIITPGEKNKIETISLINTLVENVIPETVNIKIKPDGYKKTLQIKGGMKPVRALQKIMEYFEKDYCEEAIHYTYKEFKLNFESFRIAHSLVLNEKNITGNFTISIHPMDFVTMSNNSLGWSSCMEWDMEDPGGYHAGTIEMMNSNNVVCCYMEAKEPFEFYKNEKTGECFLWNNKKWRSLAIVTPEIILSGKAYPYENKDMAYFMLDTIKDLVKDNLGWEYTYGIEPYKDMIHINGSSSMYNNRMWIRTKNAVKHNIIVHTEGMYNDYLNANIDYYCYRNKVKKNTIITYSGKAHCTCCGDEYLSANNDYDLDYNYNERYVNTDDDICYDCRDKISCNICGCLDNNEDNNLFIYNKTKTKRICTNCFRIKYRKCPDCNKIYTKDNIQNNVIYYSIEHKKITDANYSWALPVIDKYNTKCVSPRNFTPMVACKDCLSKVKETLNLEPIPMVNFNYNNKYFYTYQELDEDFVKKYSWSQQETLTEEEMKNIDF